MAKPPLSTRARRWVYVTHRWLSIATCILMLLWLASGVVMLFVGYPKLLPEERLAALPALQAGAARAAAPPGLDALALASVAGQPRYRAQDGGGAWHVFDAGSGSELPRADSALALASAHRFMRGAGGRVAGLVDDDRWTHARALDAHRPLWRVEMADEAATRLYVSSATGEVLLDLPRSQRLWNYVGAWLHWLYMFRDGSRDPVWSWLVIALSALATVSVLAGALAGIWRWRFAGRYKSGSRSPYRGGAMYWHHVLGLGFGAVLLAWIFSGLMSMNPLGVFDARGPRPDLAAYRGAAPDALPALPAGAVLERLQAAGFVPVELEWRTLAGQPFVLARDAGGATRIARLQADGGIVVQARWRDADLVAWARRLMPSAPLLESERLAHGDAYYYARAANSMYAGAGRTLPVLRLRFGDPGQTLVYLDPASSDVVLSLDRAQRAGRWLFNFLHSWDLPAWLRHGAARDAALILLSLGAAGIAATGTWVGWRRLRYSAQGERLRADGPDHAHAGRRRHAPGPRGNRAP